MANKYGVVRSDLLTGTDIASHLRNIRYMGLDGKTPSSIENGCVAFVGRLISRERNLWEGTVPPASAALKDIVLIATPEVMYDWLLWHNLDNFINEEDDISRGYILHTNDIVSMSEEAFDIADGDPEAGWVVELQGTERLRLSPTLTRGVTSIGELIAIDRTSRYVYYVIRIDERCEKIPETDEDDD